MEAENIFASVIEEPEDELFDLLLNHGDLKIERIVSKGHTSPKSGWYDQDQNEWVIVLKGAATITLENDKPIQLKVGSYLNIPAHTKHKVTWTKPEVATVWLAVHY